MLTLNLAGSSCMFSNISICGKPRTGRTAFAMEMAEQLTKECGDIDINVISDEEVRVWETMGKKHNVFVYDVFNRSSADCLYEEYSKMLAQYDLLSGYGGLREYQDQEEDAMGIVPTVVIYDCNCSMCFDSDWISIIKDWCDKSRMAEYYLILITNQEEAFHAVRRKARTCSDSFGELAVDILFPAFGQVKKHSIDWRVKDEYMGGPHGVCV